MKLSIILPTYNGKWTIEKSIQSVLAQSFSDWELLVIDDGSIDGTGEIVKKFTEDSRIKYFLNEKNIGLQKSLNNGLSIAQGEYFARIDDDDMWTDDDKIVKQMKFLDENVDYVLVGTDAFLSDENGKIIERNVMPKTDEKIRKKILSKNCFLHPTIMTRKNVLKEIGGYDENKETLHAEDYDLWLRLGRKGKMANLDFFGATLMKRKESITSSNRAVQAKRIFKIAWKNRKYYRNKFLGITISLARYIFFRFGRFFLSPKVFYFIQRIYKNI